MYLLTKKLPEKFCQPLSSNTLRSQCTNITSIFCTVVGVLQALNAISFKGKLFQWNYRVEDLIRTSNAFSFDGLGFSRQVGEKENSITRLHNTTLSMRSCRYLFDTLLSSTIVPRTRLHAILYYSFCAFL